MLAFIVHFLAAVNLNAQRHFDFIEYMLNKSLFKSKYWKTTLAFICDALDQNCA